MGCAAGSSCEADCMNNGRRMAAVAGQGGPAVLLDGQAGNPIFAHLRRGDWMGKLLKLFFY
ncbi:hypothetical protein QR66_07840 [Chromobacterium piscinae]|nr:hypothetical protein QR66_07840 [Chromobacterium piscinae]